MADIVTIRYETFTANICLSELPKLRIVTLKKLFRLLRNGIDIYGHIENEEARDAIAEMLDALVDETKEKWRHASETFNREYVDADFRFRRNSKQWKEAKRRNKAFLAEVKRTKRECERAKKLKLCFDEILDENMN